MPLFVSYVPPGVYVDTFEDNATPLILAGTRLPALIGTSSQNLSLKGFELIRGSSAISDIQMIGEDLTFQLTGNNNTFTVAHTPIVDGSGTSTTSNDPTTVEAFINGQQVDVIQVDGASGKVVLAQIPNLSDVVSINYFFSRKDTLVVNDDVSNQANGANVKFQVDFFPIVSGNNGGITTTDPTLVTVTVNGLVANVKAVDGTNGIITLAAPPGPSDVVLATYYYNSWQYTYDYLPQNIDITGIVSVGNAPGRSDYFQGTDFVLISSPPGANPATPNLLMWGASALINPGITNLGISFDNTQISTQLYDNRFYARQLSGVVNGTNRTFTLEQKPTDGSGQDVVTDDEFLLNVYVGTTVAAAIAAGPVKVDTLVGMTQTVVLKTAPGGGNNVYATYYYNLINDQAYVLDCTLTGPVGDYTVTSEDFGAMFNYKFVLADCNVVAPNFAIEHITFPASHDDSQALPGRGVAETVTLTFTSPTSYTVTSSIVGGGSGSGGGNIGYLGQTYVDAVTGLRFTILPPSTFSYAVNDTLVCVSSGTLVTSPSVPELLIPGIKFEVSNLTNVGAGNTALITTFNKSGNDPDVGDSYYVTLNYLKTDYTGAVYTDFTSVVSAFGDPNNIDNRLSVGANLAFLNGSSAVALIQVLTGPDGMKAPDSAYITAITTLESAMPNNVIPNVIVPLTNSYPVIQFLNKHVTKVSNSRYSQERTGMFGFAPGTSPEAAQLFVKTIKNQRMLAVYPDGAIITLADALGNNVETPVDGSFLAAAMAGLACNAVYDVATPLTRKSLTGFTNLIRTLDAVQMNQCAASGITILTENLASIQIRHAVTTDPTNALTREPTITYIIDEVQRETRAVLDPFVGTKFVANRLADIEVALTSMFKSLVQGQIIVAFQGVSATINPVDPTIADVVALYSPVFPLNWIKVNYTIRTSL